MSGISRGAPEKVTIKVRGDGQPLVESGVETEPRIQEQGKSEESVAAALDPTDTLARLAERARGEGPPLVVRGVASLRDGDPESTRSAGVVFAGLAADGPRTASRGTDYALIVEAVREGYLCHYADSRILDRPDADLALLAGDLFYAIGISGLAELDDLEATETLSDLIKAAADLQAAGRPDLAEIVWIAQVVALACGKDESYREAFAALEEDREVATATLADWSARIAEANGLRREFDLALSAIDSGPSNP